MPDAAVRKAPRTCERSSRKRGRALTRARACPGSWRRSSSATSPAESSLTVSCVRCGGCGDKLLVAFSCKGRGFCPSCTTRRMHDTAARLVDGVLPRVPVPAVGLVTAAGSWRATRGWQAGRWKWRCDRSSRACAGGRGTSQNTGCPQESDENISQMPVGQRLPTRRTLTIISPSEVVEHSF